MGAVKQMAAWTLVVLVCVPVLAGDLSVGERVSVLIERADSQIAAHKADDALKRALSATELAPSNPLSWAVLGRALAAQSGANLAAAASGLGPHLAKGASGADTPVAMVNGKPFMRSTLITKIEDQVGSQALGGMINKQLLEDAVVAAGITASDAQVNEQIGKIKQQFPTPEAFTQALASQNMNEAELVESIRLDLELKQLATRDVVVTDEALAKFLETNRAKLDQPETVTYSEILVTDEAKAKELAAGLSKPDANFAAVAQKDSTAYESAQNGGKVGPCPRTAIAPPAVAANLATLKVGETSAPVKDDEGWRIVKLEGVSPAVVHDLAKDRAYIEEAFKTSQAKQPQQLMAEVRAKSDVKILDPKYSDLQKAFAPAPAPAPAPAQPEGGK